MTQFIPLPERLPLRAKPYEKLAVLGAGSWGTALAALAKRAGTHVSLWGRDVEAMSAVATRQRNATYLPDVPLPAGIDATTSMQQALDGAEAVLLVTPSRSIREVCAEAARHLDAETPVALCAKGVEAETGLMMTQVAEAELGVRPCGVLSGPTFAREAALGHPTAATVAFPFTHQDRLAPAASPAARLAVSVSTESFRAYLSDDPIGVEIGGAVKNVIAIACGMMTGAGFAENTRAALITRGVDEMKALAEALGGRRETVTGLAGIGDLSLTCSSPTSRNMALGMQLGAGKPRTACFDGRAVVVEGELNALSVTQLAHRMRVRMPICETVRAILHEGDDLGLAFARLWSSPIEGEPRTLAIALDHPAHADAVTGLARRIA
ncbi:NAD(P)H-dependent glycerol-3-phosphate dehydrogenase [Tropicimonas marinistellae]|uniref:NAD(P)H-dependent glycerol-3-phosphate dehydrogenase n=1 Tax=Tropicimonas marinistellae TaxID=1739787 RepID=UPI00098F133A|nr:NAD(P)H-dependent glycerol-3-phosphate dehydrogenase [Tropicimonas marinistellae]